MRALEVKIHNFRSIHDAEIRLEPLSLLAGANNSGKSNVIDAIRIFYGDLKWDASRDAPKVKPSDEESWIEIEFLLTEDELAMLKEDYRREHGTFRVRNYLKPSIGSDGKARAGYYAYENDELSENLFYGAKNVGSGKVGHIVYIPAVSKIDDNTKLSGPSALRGLIAEVLDKVVADSPAYTELKSAFHEFESSIKTQTSKDGQSLASLENEVTDAISSWDASFTLGIQSVQPDDILKTLIKPQLIDETHGEEIDQSRFGAGFQRHLIYTLISLAAKHANPRKAPSEAKKEFTPHLTWILFEEPEAFLHPSQEEVLHDSLLQLVQDGSTQVLLTTHSSRFVSRTMDDLTRYSTAARPGSDHCVPTLSGRTRSDFHRGPRSGRDNHAAQNISGRPQYGRSDGFTQDGVVDASNANNGILLAACHIGRRTQRDRALLVLDDTWTDGTSVAWTRGDRLHG